MSIYLLYHRSIKAPTPPFPPLKSTAPPLDGDPTIDNYFGSRHESTPVLPPTFIDRPTHISINQSFFIMPSSFLSPPFLCFLLFFFSLTPYPASSAKFYLVSSGPSYKRLRPLSPPTAYICPRSVGRPFTIECVPGTTRRFVSIRVNGEWQRTELRPPYFVSGDVFGRPRSWLSRPNKRAYIVCRPVGKRKRTVSITVVFWCDGGGGGGNRSGDNTKNQGQSKQKPKPRPQQRKPPTTQNRNRPRPSTSNAPAPRPRQNTPSRRRQSPEPAPGQPRRNRPAPSNGNRPRASPSPPRRFRFPLFPPMRRKPTPSPSPARVKPPGGGGSSGNNVKAKKKNEKKMNKENRPRTQSDSTSSSSGLAVPKGTSGNGCIVVDARRDLDSPLSENWSIDNAAGGLTFRKGDAREFVTKEGKSPLYYNVKATASSQFAIVVDMTTRANSEHNDIWVNFQPGGLQAMLKKNAFNKGGWIKGYHGENGRAALTLHVDFTPHAISTGKSLTKGETYSLGIGGRSSKVTVHRIVLFPCSGLGCQRSSAWTATLTRCLGGTLP